MVFATNRMRSTLLRAAELSVEAAAARLGWERSRILTLTAVLDANGEGRVGFEAGPGIDVSVPIFNRNQGGRLRGQSELRRASAVVVQLQRQIDTFYSSSRMGAN